MGEGCESIETATEILIFFAETPCYTVVGRMRGKHKKIKGMTPGTLFCRFSLKNLVEIKIIIKFAPSN